MTRPFFVLFCMGFVAGCGSPSTEAGGDVTLKLNRLQDGNLEYCDADGECHELPYEGECAALEITIDVDTGASCERCIMDDGSVVDHGCTDVTVGCTVVTIPDPDCVVCAYYNGAVVYSSCVPEAEPECVDDAGCHDDAGLPGYCLDGRCVYEPGCGDGMPCPAGFRCDAGVCVPGPTGCQADADCPEGLVCEVRCADDADGDETNGCEGVCVDAGPTCEGVACHPGEHCELQDVYCFAAPCPPVPVCVPDGIDCNPAHAMCDCLPPACPPGLVPSVVDQCWGECVPAEVCAPMPCYDNGTCPAGFTCAPVDCMPEDADCFGGGMCVPADPCADVRCEEGTHCEVRPVLCEIAEPCLPAPVCVPDPVRCDARDVLCEVIPPACPAGLVPSVDGACWGPCVEPELCAPIPCDDGWACPTGFRCEGFGEVPDPELSPGVCVYEPPFVDCNLSHTICDVIPPTCPDGLVPSVDGVCYGECVAPERCAPIDCSTDADCPADFNCALYDCADPEFDCPTGGVCFYDPRPDEDCVVTGCSGQICSDAPVGTTCEYLPEYACYAEATCERQADGACGWTMDAPLTTCLEEARR